MQKEDFTEHHLQLGDGPLHNFTETLQNLIKVKRKYEIDQIVVQKIDISQQEQQTLELNITSKVLTFENCITIQEFFQTLRNEKTQTFLNKSSNCFVLIANVFKEGPIPLTDEDFVDMFEGIDLGERPFVIQINVNHPATSKIFFKNHGETKFRTFDDKKEKSEEDFKLTMQTPHFDFEIFLTMLNSKVGSILNCDMLKWKIDTSDGNRLIDLAVKADNVLTVRFLKLFAREEVDVKSLVLAARVAGSETFSALLDLSINDDGKRIRLKKTVAPFL